MPKYKSTMRSSVRDRAKARDSQGFGSTAIRVPSDVEMFKPSKKIHNLDIIPYVVTDPKHPDRGDDPDSGAQVGSLWYSRRYFVHRNIGSNRDTYICPNKTWGAKCPICEYANTRREEGAEKEELAELRPKERQLFNVIDLDDDPDTVKLMDSSYHLFGHQLNTDVLEGDEEFDGFAELEGGYTLKARFQKKSFQKNEFWECDRIDFKERKQDYDEDIIEQTVPLDDILVRTSYKDLEKIFFMEEDGEEDEEERKPPKKLKKGKGRDRDEEDDDEEEEEEEEEKTSRKSRNKKPSKKVEEEEEDEDDEDEDEEEERTTRRKKTSKKKPSKKVEEEEEDEDNEDEDEDEQEDEEEEDEKPASRKSRKSRSSDKRAKKKQSEEDEDEDEEDEDDDEQPVKKAAKKSKKKTKQIVCPVEDGEFGKTCEDFDECDSCKYWQACSSQMK